MQKTKHLKAVRVAVLTVITTLILSQLCIFTYAKTDDTGKNWERTDLEYYFGDDAKESGIAEKIVEATIYVPSPGVNLCSEWVCNVYYAAGISGVSGDARDVWEWYGCTDDITKAQEGMIISVPHTLCGEIGWIYGHVGILIKNPDFDDAPDCAVQQLKETKARIAELNVKNIESGLECTELLDAINKLRSVAGKIENKYFGVTRTVDGIDIRTDADGDEEWLVVHNIGVIATETLSDWISKYNVTGEVKWGWGYPDKEVYGKYNIYTDPGYPGN